MVSSKCSYQSSHPWKRKKWHISFKNVFFLTEFFIKVFLNSWNLLSLKWITNLLKPKVKKFIDSRHKQCVLWPKTHKTYYMNRKESRLKLLNEVIIIQTYSIVSFALSQKVITMSFYVFHTVMPELETSKYVRVVILSLST